MTQEIQQPSASHPITTERTGAHVVVRTPGGAVLADTTAAIAMQESTYPVVQYVPLADVDQALLQATSTSTYCPFKGDASYCAVTAEPELGDVLWTYLAPYDAVAEIAGHVAFHPDRVHVNVVPA